METIRFLATLAGASIATAVRRMLFGRARPSWSLSQEAFVRAMRESGKHMMRVPAAKARAVSDFLQSLVPSREDVRIEPVEIGGLPALRFTPDRLATDAPTLLYFHGGAYVIGSPRSYASHLSEIAAESECVVVAPHYRLAPEHPFPAAFEDGCRAIAEMLEKEAPDAVVLGGDSAGGGLVLACLLCRRDRGEAMPAGVVLSSPWVDLAADRGSILENAGVDWGDERFLAHFADVYLAGGDPRDPRASPFYGDLSGLPPIRAQVGGAELMRDQVLALAANAQEAGVDAAVDVWPDMIHGFWTMAPFFPAHEAVQELATWIRNLRTMRERARDRETRGADAAGRR